MAGLPIVLLIAIALVALISVGILALTIGMIFWGTRAKSRRASQSGYAADPVPWWLFSGANANTPDSNPGIPDDGQPPPPPHSHHHDQTNPHHHHHHLIIQL